MKRNFFFGVTIAALFVANNTHENANPEQDVKDMVTLAEELAAKPDNQKKTYKMMRKADGTLDFTDGLQDCSEFIYHLMKEKNSDLYDKLSDKNAGNVTILKDKILSIGGRFSNLPVAPCLAIWADGAAGKHVELVVKVEPKPVQPPNAPDYRFTSIGARGADGTPVPHKLVTQTLNSFKAIRPTSALIGFWNFTN